MKRLLTTITCLFLFLVTTFSQSNDANRDNETVESKKGYFVFLMDSLNTALKAFRDQTSNAEKFTYSGLGIMAKDRMQGKILDEFTKVEISDWTTYRTENCGWPYSSADKDWKAIEFSSREGLMNEWRMCYRRILFRIEVCGGNRYLAVYEKKNDNPILETFLEDPISKYESFQEQDEAVKFLFKEMRRAVPYPVENGYSLKGNFYAERRNKILKQLGEIAYFPYNAEDKMCGVWLDSKENKVYIVGPNSLNGLVILPLDYPSLFNKNFKYALTVLKNVKVNTQNIEFNYEGDMWTQTRRVIKIEQNQITFNNNRTWSRIITTSSVNGSQYYKSILLQKEKLEEEKKSREKEEILRKEEERKEAIIKKKEEDDFLQKNKLRPEITVTSTGLQYEIIREPKKKNVNKLASSNDKIKIGYKGTFTDNTEFDPLFYSDIYISDKYVNPMPDWWLEAAKIIPLGAIYKFYVPSSLSNSGEYADSRIPPNTTVIYEIEMIDIDRIK